MIGENQARPSMGRHCRKSGCAQERTMANRCEAALRALEGVNADPNERDLRLVP